MKENMRVIIDEIKYLTKPTDSIIPSLVSRITKGYKRLTQDVTLEELANKIEQGYTWVACTLQPVNGEVRKSIANWQSTQIICLDFDNTEYVPDPNDPKKKIKKKKVTWTIDRAIEEFRDSAVFIYPSFNHAIDYPKFRVVFALDEEITNYAVFDQIINKLMSKYPDVDEQCKDAVRLWFGTNSKVIPLNLENRLDTSWMDIDYDKAHQIYMRTNEVSIKNKNPYSETMSKLPITDYIKNNDILSLQSYICSFGWDNDEEQQESFCNVNDVYKYLNKQDMRQFLGVKGNVRFRCVFEDHEDNNPSAHIFKGGNDSENPVWLYRCNSCMGSTSDGKRKVYNLVQLVERISKWDTVRTRNFLMKVYGLKFEESEWTKINKEIVDDNIRRLMNVDEWADSFPTFYGIIKKNGYKDKIIRELLFAKDHIRTENFADKNNGLPLFWMTSQQAHKELGFKEGKKNGAHEKVNKLQAMFSYLMLINRVQDEDIPEFLLSNAKQSTDHKYHSSFYSIPSYSTYHLENMETKAKVFRDANANINTFTREGVYFTFGEEELKRCFPQSNDQPISDLTFLFYEKLKETIKYLLETRGCVIEDEAMLFVEYNSSMFVKKNGQPMKNPPSKKSLFSKTFPAVIQYFSLEKVKAKQVYKERYNIQSDGFPYIYITTNSKYM